MWVLSKCLPSNIRRSVTASGPVDPAARARDTCPNHSSIKVVRGVVVSLSGAMTRAKDFLRGYSQLGI